jgi:TonB-dependent SusC/RagA subfamily outer membrane receptor
MKKLALSLLIVIFSGFALLAQTAGVSGKVVDENGAAVPFATVKLEGSKVTALTDADGSFSIKTAGGAKKLTVSSVGFKSVTVDITGKPLSILLQSAADNLKEVVVTNAFGLKQSSKKTPYSVQVISGEKLNTVVQPNLNAALGGKVAGLQLRDESNVALGRNSSVRLRGEGSIGGSSALYVIDGTPMNSSDINPQDIESITVLKGANATALFGDRASSGAIVLPLKKVVLKKVLV